MQIAAGCFKASSIRGDGSKCTETNDNGESPEKALIGGTSLIVDFFWPIIV